MDDGGDDITTCIYVSSSHVISVCFPTFIVFGVSLFLELQPLGSTGLQVWCLQSLSVPRTSRSVMLK